jgi:mRNA-degrading endonuclease toxin of MazEF toxin-antitoxin module
MVTVVPITSSLRASPTYLPLGIEDGLFQDCAANLDAIQTVRKSAIGEYIAHLGELRMGEIAYIARFALALG